MFAVHTLCTPLNALNSNKASVSSGTFTAHIYDNNTKVSELTGCQYVKIGSVYIMYFNGHLAESFTVSTMLQIKNMPCNRVLGGNVYYSGITGQLGDRTIQASVSGAFIRPNVTGEFSADYQFAFALFGV